MPPTSSSAPWLRIFCASSYSLVGLRSNRRAVPGPLDLVRAGRIVKVWSIAAARTSAGYPIANKPVMPDFPMIPSAGVAAVHDPQHVTGARPHKAQQKPLAEPSTAKGVLVFKGSTPPHPALAWRLTPA